MKNKTLEVDARNMACPMPLLKLKQALNRIESGESVLLTATDLTSKRDFSSYINMTAHQMSFEETKQEIIFTVIKS